MFILLLLLGKADENEHCKRFVDRAMHDCLDKVSYMSTQGYRRFPTIATEIVKWNLNPVLNQISSLVNDI